MQREIENKDQEANRCYSDCRASLLSVGYPATLLGIRCKDVSVSKAVVVNGGEEDLRDLIACKASGSHVVHSSARNNGSSIR